MPITWLGNQGFLSRQIAAVQAWANGAVDATVGSVTLAFAQACSAVALWLQSEVVQTVALTRAATSQGADLDSWMADWNLKRPGGALATGQITFSRYTALDKVSVPVGAQASTGPGGLVFTVIADPYNQVFDAPSNSYVMNPGTGGITVLAQASVAGSAYNVASGSITSFVSPIEGVDTVTNQSAFSGGSDPASDATFRAMFPPYIASLARGTYAAIAYAVTAVAPGIRFAIAPNTDPSGAFRPGWFVVTVDDGTGSPSPALLSNVAASIAGYAPIGSFPGVQPPKVSGVIVAASLQLGPNGVSPTAIANAEAALKSYINSLPIGSPLLYLRLAQVIFDSDPNITGVQGLTLNNGQADVTVSQFGVVKVGSLSVSVLSS